MINNRKPQQPQLTEQVGVRLTPEQYAQLESFARQDKRRPGELARIVLEEYIEKRAAA